MKRIVMTVALGAVLGFNAVADTNQVYSQNAVGFIAVEIAASNLTTVAVPFNSMTTAADYTLDEVLGTNLIANSDYTQADNVYMWTGNGYAQAFLNDAGWGDPELNWKWCYWPQGALSPVACATTNIFSVVPGEGFWVKNRHDEKTVYIMGEVPSETSTDVSIGSGLTMIANPYPVQKQLDELVTTNSGATANNDYTQADNIYVWSGTGYAQAFLNDAGWGDPELDWKWCYWPQGALSPVACSTSPLFTIEPGQGFWYKARSSGFVWTENKPYNWP